MSVTDPFGEVLFHPACGHRQGAAQRRANFRIDPLVDYRLRDALLDTGATALETACQREAEKRFDLLPLN